MLFVAFILLPLSILIVAYAAMVRRWESVAGCGMCAIIARGWGVLKVFAHVLLDTRLLFIMKSPPV